MADSRHEVGIWTAHPRAQLTKLQQAIGSCFTDRGLIADALHDIACSVLLHGARLLCPPVLCAHLSSGSTSTPCLSQSIPVTGLLSP
jgi:hypothetical protein